MSGRRGASTSIARSLACCISLLPLSAAAEWAGLAEGGVSHYRRVEQQLQVPDAILTDPWGKSFSLAQELAAEGPVVLNFFSTANCQDECADRIRPFAELQGRTGPRKTKVRLISIATNPREDTPARLRLYAKQVGAGREWMLLTGLRRDIEPVLQAFGALDAKGVKGPITFVHAGPTAAWVRYDGSVSPSDLLTELR